MSASSTQSTFSNCRATFKAGEKGCLNRWYRSRVARQLRNSFITPDCLYSIEPVSDTDRLWSIAREAIGRNVELEVHPEHVEQHEFLLSPNFRQLLEGVDVQDQIWSSLKLFARF